PKAAPGEAPKVARKASARAVRAADNKAAAENVAAAIVNPFWLIY
ncbi:MAG: hypothetical protein ACI8QF_004473, partial [Limisphaerales bacterium]